jgi:hypothetical protein
MKKKNKKITVKTKLSEILKLAPACKCEACNNGCNFGSGRLVVDENINDLRNIAKHLKISEEELKEKYLEEVENFNTKTYRPKLKRRKTKDGKELPFGKCIFYDDGCKIHPVKPVECKISMGCKDYSEELNHWFMLSFLVNKNDPESVRQFNQYLRTGGKTLDDGQLHHIITNKKLLKKILNYEILK